CPPPARVRPRRARPSARSRIRAVPASGRSRTTGSYESLRVGEWARRAASKMVYFVLAERAVRARDVDLAADPDDLDPRTVQFRQCPGRHHFVGCADAEPTVDEVEHPVDVRQD